MLLPPAQGQGSLTLPSSKGENGESSKLKGPQRPLCPSLRGLCPKHVIPKEALLGSGQCPQLPTPRLHPPATAGQPCKHF